MYWTWHPCAKTLFTNLDQDRFPISCTSFSIEIVKLWPCYDWTLNSIKASRNLAWSLFHICNCHLLGLVGPDSRLPTYQPILRVGLVLDNECVAVLINGYIVSCVGFVLSYTTIAAISGKDVSMYWGRSRKNEAKVWHESKKIKVKTGICTSFILKVQWPQVGLWADIHKFSITLRTLNFFWTCPLASLIMASWNGQVAIKSATHSFKLVICVNLGPDPTQLSSTCSVP